jgi:hypothetical protein
LQLAPAALAEVTAGGRDMVRAGHHRSILAQAIARRGAPGEPARSGYAIALGGNADDLFVVAHRQAA